MQLIYLYNLITARMERNGPIIVIDNEPTEQLKYRNIFTEIGTKNKVLFFDNGREALDFLGTTKEDPFLIICDISLPKMDGLDLRRQIVANPYLMKKGTPFVFTASTSDEDVKEAFKLSVQGFLAKIKDHLSSKIQLTAILDYWRRCLEPKVIEIKKELL